MSLRGDHALTYREAFARAFFHAFTEHGRDVLNTENPSAWAALCRLVKMAGW